MARVPQVFTTLDLVTKSSTRLANALSLFAQSSLRVEEQHDVTAQRVDQQHETSQRVEQQHLAPASGWKGNPDSSSRLEQQHFPSTGMDQATNNAHLW